MSNAPLLAMASISKRFGATQALQDVSLQVAAGEVHALIGENGAGKSTLMKILAGVHRPDSGTMHVAGKVFAPTRPAAALTAGVAMIHQELNLAADLSVEASIMLGQERSWWGVIRRREHRQLAQQALAQLSRTDIPLGATVGSLPIALQQLVEIARALASNARVIVFDEPTSSLTQSDAQHLFEVIRKLRQNGLGIIYISHFLEEVAEVSDCYTVLRDGQVVDRGRMDSVSMNHIVQQMVGRELEEMFPQVPHELGETVLEISGLSSHPQPQEVNLSLRRGEILGLAGLVGAGRSELLRTIYGLQRKSGGKAEVIGRGPAASRPRQSIRRGLGLVSEDRKSEGLAVEMPIVDNLTLTALAPYQRLGILNLAQRRAAAEHWMRQVGCKAQGPGQAMSELSGGNQQKIAIARLLHQQARILLLDEPTRGIDVGTKADVYRLIGELAAAGHSIIMVSSYLPELLGVCDTIGVMCRGRLTELRPAAEWTAEEIMHRAVGQESIA